MRYLCIVVFALFSSGVAASTLDLPRATEIQLNSIAETLESFRADCDRFPSKVEFLELARIDGKGCKSAHYLRSAQLSDHWGSEIVYEVNDGSFNLLSVGADRLRETSDDIVYGLKERPWRSAYRDAIDPRDDFVDRWRNVIALIVVVAAAMAIGGVIQRRKSRRKQ
ncbi:type II secretion system protein GspG [Tahibacter aquaticus]|uniref:type II secretion system protein GspG n=1 Tax=Tahibacter aquaticus TaxID=520092 RepID=UPI00105EAD65|nr:type II secretion system protein GspG [Tahibacter aquaticus]